MPKSNKEPIKVLHCSGEGFTYHLVIEIKKGMWWKMSGPWKEIEMCLHSEVTLQHLDQAEEEKLVSIN